MPQGLEDLLCALEEHRATGLSSGAALVTCIAPANRSRIGRV